MSKSGCDFLALIKRLHRTDRDSARCLEPLLKHPSPLLPLQVSATTDGLRIVAGLYIGKIMGSPLPLGIGAGHKAALLAGPASDRPRRGWLAAQRQGLKGQPGKTCCEA